MKSIKHIIGVAFFGCFFAMTIQAADTAQDQAADTAQEGVGKPKPGPRKFTFSENEIAKSYKARKYLEVGLNIKFKMHEEYNPPKGREYILSYNWNKTWKELKSQIQNSTGLEPERQFLYTIQNERIDSLPKFHLHLKSKRLENKALFLYDEELGLPVLQMPLYEVPSDDESKSDED